LKLTIGKVKSLVGKPGKKDRQIADDEQRGLRVRVGMKAVAGSFNYKTYLVRYSIDGVKRSMPIGACSAIPIEEARRIARKIMGAVADRKDPALERRARRHARAQTLTIGKLIEQWVAIGLKERSATYKYEAPRALRLALAGRLDSDAASFTRKEAIALVDALVAAERPQMARSLAGYGSSLYSWALERELVKLNPFLKLPLPEATERSRTLGDEEIRAVWSATAAPGPFNAVIRMLLLTGQRLNEVARMTWSELDSGLATWTLPSERAKNNVAHIVPLSTQARAIVAAQPRMAGNEFVFASRTGAVSDFTRPKQALDKASGVTGWVLHDCRRSVATNMQKLGVRLEVVEALLNHVGGSRAGIVGVYQRHKYVDEKRAAMAAWGARLEAIVEGREPESNVTQLMRALG
jgi:integrase